MKSIGIHPFVFHFLKALAKNNNRPWFQENKQAYHSAHEHMINFADRLIVEMSKVDELVPMTGKQSLFRIYRDVRFSKNKLPYKNSMSGRLRRATALRRGGMYYHIEPENSFVAGGFWNPNPEDLKRIREELAVDPQPLRRLVQARAFKRFFGSLRGEQVKTAPRGFTKNHPCIDLLRYKQFLLVRNFTDAEVLDDSFLQEVVKTYRAMHPFFHYMSEILTTDANGVSIV